eukprot:2132068-Rhodomonas_salina.3
MVRLILCSAMLLAAAGPRSVIHGAGFRVSQPQSAMRHQRLGWHAMQAFAETVDPRWPSLPLECSLCRPPVLASALRA